MALMESPDKIKDERLKAKANKGKYAGVSSAEMSNFGTSGHYNRSFNDAVQPAKESTAAPISKEPTVAAPVIVNQANLLDFDAPTIVQKPGNQDDWADFGDFTSAPVTLNTVQVIGYS